MTSDTEFQHHPNIWQLGALDIRHGKHPINPFYITEQNHNRRRLGWWWANFSSAYLMLQSVCEMEGLKLTAYNLYMRLIGPCRPRADRRHKTRVSGQKPQPVIIEVVRGLHPFSTTTWPEPHPPCPNQITTPLLTSVGQHSIIKRTLLTHNTY